jgi:GINS complex subunit 2
VTPPELELVASEQLVEIIPLISMEKTAFISGAYGPLRPPIKSRVPLWMAVNLKLKKKCHIVPPDWLNVEFLQERLARETTQPVFSDLPFRFAEISKVLLDVASDDLQNPEKIRTVLKDLREARQAKSRDGLQKLDHSELSLPNLCSMEINEIRPFFVRAMSVLSQFVREQAAQTGHTGI